jgi:hypothetical protein
MSTNIRGEELFEHIVDFDVPELLLGKNITLFVDVCAETGDSKQEWHFEGISVIINRSDQIQERLYYPQQQQNK